MIRQATPEEVRYYEERLYPLQDQILGLMEGDAFYLSGGTCLSRFYFHHRYSDDLDFFFDGEKYPKEQYRELFYQIYQKIKVKKEITVDAEYFKRIMVQDKSGTNLKLEFIYEYFPRVGAKVPFQSFFIDNKKNVAANKLTAIHGRNTNKDYFDLWYLLEEIDLEVALKGTETKMVPLDYEGTIMALDIRHRNDQVFTTASFEEKQLREFIRTLKLELIRRAKNT